MTFPGDFFTGEVVGGTREPGKRLAHDPEVASSSNAIACSGYREGQIWIFLKP